MHRQVKSYINRRAVSPGRTDHPAATTLTPSASITSSASALYNFKLLAALRSENAAEVQPFLDELRPSSRSAEGLEDAGKAGRLLGMAVGSHLVCIWAVLPDACRDGSALIQVSLDYSNDTRFEQHAFAQYAIRHGWARDPTAYCERDREGRCRCVQCTLSIVSDCAG
jgi:hypothetical protein